MTLLSGKLLSEWIALNPILRVGEIAYERDTGKRKVGDGVTSWASLPYSLYVSSVVTDTSYIYNQNTPSSFWDIFHNLGYYPNVTVVDSAGSNVEGDVAYVSQNHIQLTFAAGFSGRAFLS